MGLVKNAIILIVTLAALFIAASTLVMPFFSTTYEYGFGTEPCSKTSCLTGNTNLRNEYCIAGTTATPDANAIACANCNRSAGYSTYLGSCYALVSAINGTHCYPCTNFGFKATNQGLMLFILFIGLLAFIIMIITKVLPKFK